MEDTYQKYIEVKNKISELKDIENVLSEQVMKKMLAEKVDKIESETGLITVAKRKSWKYSDSVSKKNDELKALKKEEEENGTATQEEKEYLRVTLR